jgi:hypothetical protein
LAWAWEGWAGQWGQVHGGPGSSPSAPLSPCQNGTIFWTVKATEGNDLSTTLGLTYSVLKIDSYHSMPLKWGILANLRI